MSDKFSDYANRNVVRNPLLSSAVTGIALEDLTHNAILVPVAENPVVPAIQTNKDENENKKPEQLNQPVQTAKPNDDFDVNEYIARLHGTRYVSAPINAAIDSNIETTDENLEEINLNDDTTGQSAGLTADIAQNFSQLPAVLPQVANAVFSSFSNMLSMRGRDDGQDRCVEQTQEVLQQIKPPPQLGQPPEVKPPPLVQPPPANPGTSYRLQSKKKYAQIPGLTQTININNPVEPITQPSFNDQQYYPYDNIAKNQHINIDNRLDVTEKNNEVTTTDTVNNNKNEQEIKNEDIFPNISHGINISKTDDVSLNPINNDKSSVQHTPIIPPPQMFSASTSETKDTTKSVLPPSVARRLGSHHPVIKNTSTLPKFEANYFVPSFDQSAKSDSVQDGVTNAMNPLPIRVQTTQVPLETYGAPNYAQSYGSQPLSTNVPEKTVPKPISTTNFTSHAVPLSVTTPVDIFNPSVLAQNSLEPMIPLCQTTVNCPPVAMNLENQPETNIVSQSNTSSSSQQQEQKPLLEPPKLPSNINLRMTKKRPQYYSGPIQGVGNISNNYKPVIPPVSNIASPVYETNQAHFQPNTDIVSLQPNIGITDLSKSSVTPMPDPYNTAFDLSRPADVYAPPKEEKSFGILGSLKTKLGSIDINKIQNTVTTFFDPAYNDAKSSFNAPEHNTQNVTPTWNAADQELNQSINDMTSFSIGIQNDPIPNQYNPNQSDSSYPQYGNPYEMTVPSHENCYSLQQPSAVVEQPNIYHANNSAQVPCFGNVSSPIHAQTVPQAVFSELNQPVQYQGNINIVTEASQSNQSQFVVQSTHNTDWSTSDQRVFEHHVPSLPEVPQVSNDSTENTFEQMVPNYSSRDIFNKAESDRNLEESSRFFEQAVPTASEDDHSVQVSINNLQKEQDHQSTSVSFFDHDSSPDGFETSLPPVPVSNDLFANIQNNPSVSLFDGSVNSGFQSNLQQLPVLNESLINVPTSYGNDALSSFFDGNYQASTYTGYGSSVPEVQASNEASITDNPILFNQASFATNPVNSNQFITANTGSGNSQVVPDKFEPTAFFDQNVPCTDVPSTSIAENTPEETLLPKTLVTKEEKPVNYSSQFEQTVPLGDSSSLAQKRVGTTFISSSSFFAETALETDSSLDTSNNHRLFMESVTEPELTLTSRRTFSQSENSAFDNFSSHSDNNRDINMTNENITALNDDVPYNKSGNDLSIKNDTINMVNQDMKELTLSSLSIYDSNDSKVVSSPKIGQSIAEDKNNKNNKTNELAAKKEEKRTDVTSQLIENIISPIQLSNPVEVPLTVSSSMEDSLIVPEVVKRSIANVIEEKEEKFDWKEKRDNFNTVTRNDNVKLDVQSIERDAKNSEFTNFRDFLIEPTGSDDEDVSTKEDVRPYPSFTDRIESYKKLGGTQIPAQPQITTQLLEEVAGPSSVSMASYFDTGNFAADTYYQNTAVQDSVSKIGLVEEDFGSKIELRVFKRSVSPATTHIAGSIIDKNDTKLKKEFKLADISQLDFDDFGTSESIHSYEESECKQKQDLPIFDDKTIVQNLFQDPTLDKHMCGDSPKKTEPEKPKISPFFSKELPENLQDSFSGFSKGDCTGQPNRLASYFTKTDDQKSFFELGASQNHLRKNIDNLMQELTSIDNYTPNQEQVVKIVNYFNVEYDFERNKNDLENKCENVGTTEKNNENKHDNNKHDCKNKDEINPNLDKHKTAFENNCFMVQNCFICSNYLNLNSSFKCKQAMDSNNTQAGTIETLPTDEKKTSNVSFDLPEYENKEEGLMLVSFDNRPSSDYAPVKHHWFYRKDSDGKAVWRGFSTADSSALEKAFLSPTLNEGTVVPTDGGRYDVNIMGRLRFAVYWADKPNNVLRCSWFFKGTTDARYVPYSEAVADQLEDEYRKGVTQGVWHRRIELPNNEVVIMHTPTVMVHFLNASTADAWTGQRDTTPLGIHENMWYQVPDMFQSTTRPRVVRRGHNECEIEEAEPSKIDHVLLMCHGVGSACDMKFRGVEEVVEDFRSTSMHLVQSHYRNSFENGTIGRVEVLPISWHSTLHSGERGVDVRLDKITLKSIPLIRSFTNDTVLDVLFYTSPVYCQTIIDTVCKELNRIYSLFKTRNPDFNGGISLGGHSLGSVILYDLLCHQEVNNEKVCIQNSSGTGQPIVKYPKLVFSPTAFYALGSPIAIFECIRGVESLGENFSLPTCANFFNIFHPYDPIAYRIEPLINGNLKDVPPFLIPHHKGRKRMHLELKDTMARVGADLKQKLVESIKATWSSMWRTQPPTTEQLQKVVEEEIEKGTLTEDHKVEVPINIDQEKATHMLGKLNGGRRVDYVLQEAPLEMINEYLFAMSSHVCYWESEDTMLLILHEIYSSFGVKPDSSVPQPTMKVERETTKDGELFGSSENPSTSYS